MNCPSRFWESRVQDPQDIALQSQQRNAHHRADVQVRDRLAGAELLVFDAASAERTPAFSLSTLLMTVRLRRTVVSSFSRLCRIARGTR